MLAIYVSNVSKVKHYVFDNFMILFHGNEPKTFSVYPDAMSAHLLSGKGAFFKS